MWDAPVAPGAGQWPRRPGHARREIGDVRARSLAALRDDVSRVDREMLRLLAERRRLAVAIVGVKDEAGAAVRDQGREEELLVARHPALAASSGSTPTSSPRCSTR